MKIIIAGAGAVGFHLAQLLANENQDITLIDTDEEILNHVASHLDVMTLRGDATSIEVLTKAQISKAKLFLAVTTSQTTNLLSAILAKQLGVKQTIARVNTPEYLSEEQKKNFFTLGIDNLFSPLQLAAQEIERLLLRCSFTDVFEFEKGKISVIGFTIDNTSPLMGKSLREINSETSGFLFKAIAILRNEKTIIPFGDNILKREDHLYLVTKNEFIDRVTKFVGLSLKKIKRVMIIGGSPLALATAQTLENKYSVTLFEQNKNTCKKLIEKLHNTLVIKADPSNIEQLKEEGLEEMDAFIALTPNSETNIITSLMAEQSGVYKTIALVDNVNYTHISQNIGVDTIINKKLIAANNIFRFVRKGKIEAITSLHGVEAEVIEFIIHKENRLTKNPIRSLRIPQQAIIVGVIRGENSFIPDGDFQMNLHDKVIVFAMPEAIGKVEALFR